MINVSVSFGLALWVAIRARGVRAPERRVIYQVLAGRILRQPWILLIPPHEPAESPTPKPDGESGN